MRVADQCDVVVIGAGPAGSTAAQLLASWGWSVALIHRAGGVCVLAHPGTFRETTPVPEGLIDELAQAGLDGIEASHPEHTPEVEARYIAKAESLDLVWTGSSDCHGTRYESVRLAVRTTPPESRSPCVCRRDRLRAATRGCGDLSSVHSPARSPLNHRQL